MSKTEIECLQNIVNEYPEDIEAQIRLVRYTFNVPRGQAIAILESFETG